MCFLNTRLWYFFQRETNSSLAYAIKKARQNRTKKGLTSHFYLCTRLCPNINTLHALICIMGDKKNVLHGEKFLHPKFS